jgi:hypothetical protein
MAQAWTKSHTGRELLCWLRVLGPPLFGRGFAVAEPYAPNPRGSKPGHPYPFHSTIVDLLANGWQRQ